MLLFYSSLRKKVWLICLICVSEHLSLADRCGLLGYCSLASMIFTQVCLGLATIKGHSYIDGKGVVHGQYKRQCA